MQRLDQSCVGTSPGWVPASRLKNGIGGVINVLGTVIVIFLSALNNLTADSPLTPCFFFSYHSIPLWIPLCFHKLQMARVLKFADFWDRLKSISAWEIGGMAWECVKTVRSVCLTLIVWESAALEESLSNRRFPQYNKCSATLLLWSYSESSSTNVVFSKFHLKESTWSADLG